MKLLPVLVLAVAAAVGLVGCGKAKPGDPCNNPECADSKTAYACENGSYREVPCRGTQGCSTTSSTEIFIECDETLDHAGDQCAGADVGSVNCAAPGGPIQCTGGETWTSVTCPTQCVSGGPSIGSCM